MSLGAVPLLLSSLMFKVKEEILEGASSGTANWKNALEIWAWLPLLYALTALSPDSWAKVAPFPEVASCMVSQFVFLF